MWFITVGFVCLCTGWKIRGHLERVREEHLKIYNRPISVWDLCLRDSLDYWDRKKGGEG